MGRWAGRGLREGTCSKRHKEEARESPGALGATKDLVLIPAALAEQRVPSRVLERGRVQYQKILGGADQTVSTGWASRRGGLVGSTGAFLQTPSVPPKRKKMPVMPAGRLAAFYYFSSLSSVSGHCSGSLWLSVQGP